MKFSFIYIYSGLLVTAILNFLSWEPLDSPLIPSQLYLELKIKSSKLVQRLACILQVPSWNPVQGTAILTVIFNGFPQSTQEYTGIVPRFCHDRSLSNPFT
jgi:hypothetical protein